MTTKLDLKYYSPNDAKPVLCAVKFRTMIDFTKELNRFSNKSISFEINSKTNELEIDSEEYTKNGLSVDKHTFNLSKDEAKKIVEYLSNWVSA